MLRPTLPADTTALVVLADATGFFKPHEIVALREVLDDYHTANRDFGHVARTWDDGGPLGFVYYAPTAMTDRTWELWWIAVSKTLQGRGIGGAMLAAVEADVRAADGRLLLIETSSTPVYEPTRQFYLKHRYAVAARIPDFYADGDDKIIFAKRFAGLPG
jgi:ribosomal protein S18 acetylase RimI-like enzyme